MIYTGILFVMDTNAVRICEDYLVFRGPLFTKQ